ncbi:hypothetical protein PHYSODRAFT_259868 [Phytophthora sojae]|uniref:Aquaporin n=1 Tax=Phytophthora sojae (strain P6497) TaxID=1094619 RepID=G5A716_PHYSP|nr:hypothetical protein PHYSODRAFT_259868 [Phytophthora sojae]EGZ09121.1 hypothetical protein PHYSODRAFT_259868 [Phytophthora sojae]|eukprot:XP_009535754.1 hypothetical protein PHYSODRAFT_259868 [Phytophthora sojae]
MNTVPSASRVHVGEDSFATSGQLVIDVTDKSAYADFANPIFASAWPNSWGQSFVIGFGLAVNSQVAISDGKAGDVMTVSLAWGVAVLMGVYTAENVSGSHIISVITFTHAVYGRMPWWKVPGYMLAQTLGAFVAAALVYVLHYEKISAGDLKTMHFLFVTYPHDVSNYTALYTEVLLCAFLMSLNTGLGASVNRDLGPRLFAYLAGYKEAFTEYSYYFWIPIVGPFLGGVIGAGAYILFVEIQHRHL